jgi:hypothetical protein
LEKRAEQVLSGSEGGEEKREEGRDGLNNVYTYE